jgi:arylsulfatase A-like enzyme
VLAAACAALLLACGKESRPKSDGVRPKNVLLLVADTLRANRLGCYGYPRPTTPNIDQLAARGTLYTHSYSQACWTVPSMISMMSGAYVTREETALPQQFTVLGETLRAHGMETAAFLANATLFAERGFDRGFEIFQTARMADAVSLAASFEQWHSARAAKSARGETLRPFFAWVHFVDPHQPYTPAPEHDVFHEPRPDQQELVARWKQELPRVAKLSPKLTPLPFEASAAKMVEQSNLYDGEVLAVDDGVGRILEMLRASGELDSTLVIFCADHGEMLFEHPAQPYLVEEKLQRADGLPEGVMDLFGSGHRTWYFEDLWNTPLIIAGPGFPSNTRVDGLAANLDLYPTILAALDLPAPAFLQGENLWHGVEPKRERIFASNHPTSAVRERSGKKLIVYPRQLFMLEGEGPLPAELYDVASDPREQRDLTATDPADVRRLRGEIERWRAANDRAAETQMTAEQRKGLIQMGYVGEGEGGKRDH